MGSKFGRIFGYIFSIYSLFVFFLFSPSKALAMTCAGTVARDSGDFNDVESSSAINRDVMLSFSVDKTPSEVILARYIATGEGGWIPALEFGGDGVYDYMDLRYYRYSIAKDYTVGGHWVYRNASGQVKTLSCQRCLRIFDTRETQHLGTTRLNYSPTPASATRVITGTNTYLGPVFGGNWIGNNNGFTPSPDSYLNSWKWQSTRGEDGLYVPSEHFFLYTSQEHDTYPSVLPTSITYTLTTPTFASGEGGGAYADYMFDWVTVYSRTFQKNSDGTCGSLPTIPACPNVTAACGVGANTIVVSWDPVSWASSYKVTRDGTVLSPVASNLYTTYTDTSAACGVQHSYSVNPNPLTPECTQGRLITCPCGGPTNTPTPVGPSPTPGGPTATPTPGGACISSCPSQPTNLVANTTAKPPTLSWSITTWGTYCPGQNNTYQVLIANLNFSDPGFTSANIVHDHTITTNNLAPTYVPAGFTFANDTYYYWKVIAKNGN